MPEAARPDRSGLLVSLNFERAPRNCFEGVSILVRSTTNGGGIDRNTAGHILDLLCNQLIPVWFSDGARKMLMHPDGAVASLVLSGAAAPSHLRAEVAAWRDHYGVFGLSG